MSICGENVTIGRQAFYQTWDRQGSYRKQSGCRISLTGEGIVVGEEAFYKWMHEYAFVDLTGVSEIEKMAFSELALYYRSQSNPWWECGDAVCLLSSQLMKIADDAFYRASVGRIYLDDISDAFRADNWLAMNPFGCYYRVLRTGEKPTSWEDSMINDGRENITDIAIPSSMTRIPDYAFCCMKVTSVSVPANVRYIGDNAFDGCKFLDSIMFFGDAPELGDSVFHLVPSDCKVVVYEGSRGWDEDGDGRWNGFVLEWRPLPSYTITYEGTRGALNPNPSAYKMTDEITFSALSDCEDARFVGWNPAKIERGSTGDKTVVACWETKTVSDMLKGCGDVTLSGSADWFAKWTGSEWILQSGKIGDRQNSILSCKVEGAGTLSFKWKVSSECEEGCQDDYLNFVADGEEVAWIGGEKGWIEKSIVFVASDTAHTLSWSYVKDKVGVAGDDCGWLKDIVWAPDAVAPTFDELAKVFGEDSDVAKNITDEAELAAFNDFLKNCSINSASDLKPAQKHYAYQSFKLKEITTAPRLFEVEPVLKIDDLELTGGNLTLTISLTTGAEAIQLAKDKLAEKIRVGSTLGNITGKPKIVASPAADGTSLSFTITPPEGNQGFVRVRID